MDGQTNVWTEIIKTNGSRYFILQVWLPLIMRLWLNTISFRLQLCTKNTNLRIPLKINPILLNLNNQINRQNCGFVCYIVKKSFQILSTSLPYPSISFVFLNQFKRDKTKQKEIRTKNHVNFVSSSESEGGSIDPSPTKSKSVNFAERIILNVTGQLCFSK